MELTDKKTVTSPQNDDWFYKKKAPLKQRLICFAAALLGMLVGLLPTIIYGITLYTSYPLMFFFIPFCGLLFVTIFKCRNCESAFWWILLFTLVGWYLAELFVTSAAWAHSYNIPMYETPYISCLMAVSSYLWQTITGESLYSFIFLIFGIWIAYEYTKGGHKPEESAADPDEFSNKNVTVSYDEKAQASDVQTTVDSESNTETASDEEDEVPSDDSEDSEEDDDDDDDMEFETLEDFMKNKDNQ